MKIAIITVWYNEQDLAPFFLKHYNYVDDIFLYLDVDTDDDTRNICKSFPNVTIRDIHFPNGFDDIDKVSRINNSTRELSGKYNWMYSVDSDEFIFPPKEYSDARKFLAKQEAEKSNLVRAKIWQVFRHHTDRDLDPTKPVMGQRSHGDPDLSSSFNSHYAHKPIVVKPETGIAWYPGCHVFNCKNIRIATEEFYGAHWKMADPSFVVKRRIRDRKLRFSKRQIAMRMAWQDIIITEEQILKDLEEHKQDPDILGPLLLTGV